MDKNALSLNLESATEKDVINLHGWFTNILEIRQWGGPSMDFPISVMQFIAETKLDQLNSYKLVDHKNNMLAFGQCYQRLERCHLARLVVSPDARGKGLGKYLVEQLMLYAPKSITTKGFSLFVLANNTVARTLYEKLGFRCIDYPEPMDSTMAECEYLIKDN